MLQRGSKSVTVANWRVVKRYNSGLQNHSWEFDSLLSCKSVGFFCSLFRGSLSERFNVRVLKTLEPKGSVGSNPTASAKN